MTTLFIIYIHTIKKKHFQNQTVKSKHHPGVSHLQGEDGGHRFVVTDCVLHVTPVAMLRHFGPAGQP